MTQQSQNYRLGKSEFFLHIFSFIIDVFTTKRISPDCPFKSNQRISKISILTPRFTIWHRGVQLDTAVWCTPRNLTPRCASHRRVRLLRKCLFSCFRSSDIFQPVFRIRISFHADPDPGSLKCPYGSGSRPLIFYSDPDLDPKGVKIKEDNLLYTNKWSTKFFKMTLKHY